jgi:glycosyltransferase involved in cell wall biosynthesis
MRVLHISNDYYNSGVYRTLHEGHLRHGLDSVFFVPMTKDSPAGNRDRVIEAHCFNPMDRFLYMNKQRKIYHHFREAVRQHKPELNHGYFLFSGGIHCLWAKREFGIPYVITVQDTDVNTIFKYFIHLRKLAWDIIREAECVIFVSDAYRNFALEHMVPEKHREEQAKKFRLVPFALNPFWTENADTSAHPVHEGPLRLLTVGLVIARKNQLCTAEAVRQLRQQGLDVELTVIGAGIDKKIDEKLRGMDFVRRIEQIPKEQLIEEYRRADIFVLPSLTESFGLVYAEALSQGLPVLYSAGQGFDMQFPEGYVGYRMDARDPRSVMTAIRDVMGNYDVLQANCAAAAEKFSQEAVSVTTEELYRQALSAQKE